GEYLRHYCISQLFRCLGVLGLELSMCLFLCLYMELVMGLSRFTLEFIIGSVTVLNVWRCGIARCRTIV
ncbi:hypothetical protein BgiBS90_019546, partial [Biomphalaria glabrata]